MTICSNCGEEVAPQVRFCGICGAQLEAAPTREVRKIVTVLFCDVQGSTQLAEALDPERWRHVLQRYFQALEQMIVSHGGLVEKFAGDAVMAVFGLPAAHEDDALRALRAAAEMRERLPGLAEETGFELAFRTGVNTGEVVAGSGQTLVTGDAVNVAARLEQAAQPGEILLGAETVRLAGAAVEAELLPPLAVQGKAEPVTVFRFCGLTAPAQPERAGFVGRERELALLEDAFRRASQEHTLHFVTLLGEAGIGKSRLAEEFVASLAGRAQVARGRCLSYGKALTYWPLVEVLRALGEPAQEALERVVSGGATSPQQLSWTVQRALEQAASEGPPLVVLLEDLHWAEPTLLDLLDSVADRSRGAPILLLCVARTELLEQRPAWPGGTPHATSVLLEALPPHESERLSELQAPLAPEQRRRVVTTAAGNPLFLEELTSFVADGGGEEALPPRIQALLQARLDRLPKPERMLLACAAVEGVVFHRGSLESLVATELGPELPLRLATLTRTGLIRPTRTEVEGEEGFRFGHQLIRDTAYAVLAKGERGELHARFADWLEEGRGERGELDDICAYHLEQAVLYKRELGASDLALEERAALALAAAGERAHLRTDLHAAAGLWRRALALLARDDARVPELELELALVLRWLGQFAEAQQLLEHAGRQTPDPSVAAAARLAGLQAKLHSAPEDVPAAIRSECVSAIPLFEEHGDHRRLALAWYLLAQAEMAELQVQAAEQAWANAAAQAHLAGDRVFEVLTRGESTERICRERSSSTTTLQEFERLVEEFPGEQTLEGLLNVARAWDAYYSSRPEQVRQLVPEVLEAFRIVPWYAAIHSVAFGWLEMLGGELDEAERLARAGVRELRELEEHNWLGLALTQLAEIRIEQGRCEEALELAHEAEQHGHHDRMTLIQANAARARAHAHLGAIEKARCAAAEAVALAETTDSLFRQALAQYSLAETLDAAGELPAALAAAEEAARLHASLERMLFARRATALAEEIERRIARPTARTPVA